MSECRSVLEGYIVPGKPLVSVNVMTYNHGKYIRQCLDGILMQRVNFPYEVLVNDDASPDDTADIIREYEARFPTVIKPIYQTENQCSLGKVASKFNLDRAKGKYIAHCEGDDYWTDPNKLQIQIDFLEKNPEYSACVHLFKVIPDNNEENMVLFDHSNYIPGKFTLKDLEQYHLSNGLASQLATIVSHNLFNETPERILNNFYSCDTNTDTKYTLFLALNGPIYRLGCVMSVYRYIPQSGTSWSATQMIVKYQSTRLNHWFSELKKFAKKSYNIDMDYSKTRAILLVNDIHSLSYNPSKSKIADIICSLRYSDPKSILIFISLFGKKIVRKIAKICRVSQK